MMCWCYNSGFLVVSVCTCRLHLLPASFIRVHQYCHVLDRIPMLPSTKLPYPRRNLVNIDQRKYSEFRIYWIARDRLFHPIYPKSDEYFNEYYVLDGIPLLLQTKLQQSPHNSNSCNSNYRIARTTLPDFPFVSPFKKTRNSV